MTGPVSLTAGQLAHLVLLSTRSGYLSALDLGLPLPWALAVTLHVIHQLISAGRRAVQQRI